MFSPSPPGPCHGSGGAVTSTGPGTRVGASGRTASHRGTTVRRSGAVRFSTWRQTSVRPSVCLLSRHHRPVPVGPVIPRFRPVGLVSVCIAAVVSFVTILFVIIPGSLVNEFNRIHLKKFSFSGF